MAISNPPIADRGDGQPLARMWADWFTSLWNAVAGWRKTLTGSVTINFGAVAANSQAASASLTITGAAVTDVVLVQPDTQTSGIKFDGYVSAIDTVTIRAMNFTAGSIDPASTTFRVILFKQ